MQTGGVVIPGAKCHKRKTSNGEPYFWFTIVAPNGKVLVNSETYKTKQAMNKGFASLYKVLEGWKSL